ncbi:Hsp90 protein-domain-containing protein [Infundibulicybe gibba]|nr:Hsp90 protein-domain-containing protein [Infundibulicybe gibba]
MSATPFATVPPPLPAGWTEHPGPVGRIYYHNSVTQESTYRPIPGTDWLRIKTTEGNVFYSHKTKKESTWIVPEEIKDAVEELEQEDRQNEERSKSRGQQEERDAQKLENDQLAEVERVKREIQPLVKRKAGELDDATVMKKMKTGEEQEDEGDDGDSRSEDEDWQKEAEAQLAVEAEIEKKRIEKEEKRMQEAEAQRQAGIHIPERVDLSLEEGKALFKTLLREKDINPLHPWDTSLPLFVSDPRYILLPSVSARREAFDEYCRDRARELRQSNVKKEKEANPHEEFGRLLNDEVTSTRMTWADFRRSYKKDRRFYGWGRDDKEREKRFKQYIRELGEKKRAAAKKAEVDFFALLKEHAEDIPEGSPWRDVKRHLSRDPRYENVGSSSLREELFATFLKGTMSNTAAIESPSDPPHSGLEDEAKQGGKQTGKIALQILDDLVLGYIRRKESESFGMSLLTDAVRDCQTSWEAVVPQLNTDPRFVNSPLSLNHQIHLFNDHLAHIRSKYMMNLHALLDTHAPSLATSFNELPLPLLEASIPFAKLDLNLERLEQEFERWQRERTTGARKSFEEMLGENSFIDFWGRLGKIGGEGVEGGVKADDLGEDEGEGGGGKVDMKALAKSVDVHEIEKVLKNDKRYIMFDHVPEQRERMRLLSPLVFSLTLFTSYSFAQGVEDSGVPKVKHNYQSDVARLRGIVINSLYSHKDIFLRELVSNANDALEKLRLTALTDKNLWNGADPLNITIKAEKGADGKGGESSSVVCPRFDYSIMELEVISDTGIGMTPEELSTNLGTLAKSGTSDFLAKAEGQDGTGTGNLIGAFGLGFYSSFLVADHVYVASIPPRTAKSPEPVQHVFSSSADDSSFEIYPDPRGNTLGRGTEITLVLKDDATEYLDTATLTALINKHSSFSSAFPIYLFTERTEEVPDDTPPETSASSEADSAEETPVEDEDEAVVEDVSGDEDKKESPPQKMKTINVEEWVQLNAQPPLWMRDPKNVTDEEYTLFYNAFFKDFSKPLAWHHFSGDSGTGVSFKAILYLPSKLEDAYWQQPLASKSKDIRLMVKRVFITSDLGDDGLPKWASWVKVVVDAEDLPLNVSRETLQSTRFLRQLKQIIIKRLIQVFTKIAEEDEEKFKAIQETYGSILKLGAVEDVKNRDKLTSLTRFTTNQRNSTSLDEYLENKKKGQKQIFYMAEMAKSPEHLAQSIFVEKLDARGYEVLLLTEPLDEILVGNLKHWKRIPFQDVAKAGLKFGDEELDPEEEKAEQKALTEKFQPLLDWLKAEAKDLVRDVVISNRLVKSPCAVVADTHGYTANVQKMMSASNAKGNKNILHEFAMKAKLLEINPRSPLIEGLLRRVEQLPQEEDEKDLEAEEELREVASILIDGALVRSGFEVPDSNRFFTRVDRVLRRSLGVSETAPTDTEVRPAPPVDPELPSDEPEPEQPFPYFNEEEDDGKARVIVADHLKNDVSIEMEEIDDDDNPVVQHDEL